MNINVIVLKDGRKIRTFPTYEQQQQEKEAKEFLQKSDNEYRKKFDFINQHLNNLRKEFQNEFHCQQHDADYFIFNSLWK